MVPVSGKYSIHICGYCRVPEKDLLNSHSVIILLTEKSKAILILKIM